MARDTTLPSALRGPPDAPDAVLAVRWVAPGDDGRATPLGPGMTVLGRDAESTACLPSAEISRRHAEIRWVGEIPMLRDAGSTNGVFLNQRRITQAPLRPGDVLRLGDWVGVLTLARPDETGALPWSFAEVIPGYWAGPALLAALAPVRRVAATDLPVVIQGETGSGKEGAARAVHQWSGRSGRLASLNCAALPEPLAEGELFGYRKGAFTGADRASAGHLRAADGGTLFLDEIADLPLPVQGKLLRAIEQREVIPLGETVAVGVDVRLLAAAQAPLALAVEEKRFRGDLYARLNGYTLKIPPLRERREEVPFLFRKLLESHRRGSAGAPRLAPELVERLCAHDWPFNVRELVLLVRRLLALHPDASLLDETMWSDPPAGAPAPAARATPAAGVALPGEAPGGKAGRPAPDLDTEAFVAALRANRGNIKQTAAALGISRGRAYRFMERIDQLDLDMIRRGPGG